MDTIVALKTLDASIGALSAVMNLVASSQIVSAAIARRIAEGGRDWTEEERQAVQAELEASKAYAAQQIAAARSAPAA